MASVWHFKKLGLEVRCGALEFYSNPNSLDLNSAIKFWSPTHCLIKFYPALNWTGYARSGCSFVWGGVPSNINTKPFASFVNVRRRWQTCLSPHITLNIQHEYITSGYITSPWQSASPPCSKDIFHSNVSDEKVCVCNIFAYSINWAVRSRREGRRWEQPKTVSWPDVQV